MANLNRTLSIGNLTRDPELRSTPKGTPVTEISLAINRYRVDDEGHKSEEVTYVDVTLWGRLAEIGAQYLKKGNSVFVEGRLQLDTWDDKQSGQKRSKLRVVAENLQLLTKREESQAASSGAPAAPGPPRPAVPQRSQPVPTPKVNPKVVIDPELDDPF
jgi:single-strand DNA-binding protein